MVKGQVAQIPASFKVIRHIGPVMACSCCDDIVQAPTPGRPLERGQAAC
ncbi:zinc-finger binding domain of transposase IS66 [Collimonas sp. OK607]|nr:IS66 family transposase zinc-finger binding domain-containing protein [Collimonas sp. OK607]SFB21524.1 zinc-finger binding domain of transposase IS66 [Collimonas sp. OK607]